MIPLLSFLATFFLLAGLRDVHLLRARSARLQERFSRLFDIKRPVDSPFQALRATLEGWGLGASWEPALRQSGLTINPVDFVLLLMVAIGVLTALLTRLGLPVMAAMTIAMGALTGGARLFLSRRRGSLAAQVTRQLPEAVRMLAGSVHAGLSVRQGLALVAQEAGAPLGPLMKRVVHQLQLGATLEEALDGLVVQVDSRDLQLVATTILLQNEVGGDMAGALDGVASALVERLAVEGEVRTATAEQRYIAMVLPVVPIAGIFLLSAGRPGYLQVLTKPLGITLLVASVLLQGLGFFFIHRVGRIKV